MAIRAYIKQVRPPGHDRHLFVRHWGLIGRPMSVGSIRLAMILAYRRCGFPKSWNGTHILRRTFATDVHARGATMRQVADFLGHQRVATTGVYTQAALRAMRALAQPWPVSA
jgi:site-specific recombinase XerD